MRLLSAGKRSKQLLSAIEILPVALPAALAAFSLVTVVFLLFDYLNSYYVWPLGMAAALTAVYAVAKFYPRAEVKGKGRHVCNILVVFGVLVWGAFNVFYTAQHTITNRDPGTYTNAAIWLTENDSLRINVAEPFGDVEGVAPTSPGFVFAPDGESLLAQGMHLLPALLGLMGRIVGAENMLHLNVLFGMSALLAVYGFARALVRPYWALLAAAALSASMPLIYFSRDTYTEPLAATFTFGALALLWVAIKSKAIPLWFLAGLVAGAGTLTRIDGYLTVGALVFFLGIMLAISKKAERLHSLKASAALVLGMAVVSVVAWLDLSQLSTFYYISERDGLIKEALAIIAALIFAAAATIAWRTKLLENLDKTTRSWRAIAAAAGALLVMMVLASRPLWYRSYVEMGDSGEIRRKFYELSMEWIVWYLGPLLALLGAVGIVLAVYYAFKKRNLFLLATLAVILGTSLVYIVNPSIASDHVWASRRLLPVILPGVAVFGVFALDRISRDYLKRLQWKYVFVGLASTAVIIGPLLTSAPLIKTRDTALLKPVNDVCAALPENAAVLWVGAARSRLVQPTWGICGAPAAGYGKFFKEAEGPDKETLAAAASNAERNGYLPVIGLYGNQFDLFSGIEEDDLSLVSTYIYGRLESTVLNPPRAAMSTTGTIFLGVVDVDGSIRPLQ